jgi:DNA-binding NarL/FixJ family response regulator
VGEASNGHATVEMVTALQPDLLLLDVEMGDAPVLTTIRRVRRLASRTRIAIVTMHSDRVLQKQTLEAGASAFLSKAAPRAKLIEAMEWALRPSSTADVTASEELPRLLSQREEEVLRLVSRALSNKEIARRLSIAEGTVKRHTGNIYEKLGVRSRMEAMAKARLVGIAGL